MKYFIYLLAIIILFGINLGLFNSLQIRGQIPNLLFLFCLCFVLEKKDYDFFFIALVSGLFLDFFSTSFFGGFTFSFLVVVLCLHLFVTNLMVVELNWKTLSLVLVFSFFLLNLLLWLYTLITFRLNLSGIQISFKLFRLGFLPGLIYNWLLLYPVYLYWNFVKKSVENLTLRRRGIVR